MKYAFIRDHRQHYPLTRLCEMLEVSPSGYHDWRDRPESHRSRENKRLTARIAYYHRQSHEIYGSPKVHIDLVKEGEIVSVNRVARLMKVAEIKSKMAAKFVITTDSKNSMQPAPDLLQRQFEVASRDKAWVSDTYVHWYPAGLVVSGRDTGLILPPGDWLGHGYPEQYRIGSSSVDHGHLATKES